MTVFSKVKLGGHEEVVFFNDQHCGLRAIIAIHDTTLGPALGGTRMWPYDSEEDALKDVLRLSKGMTYKASISGLNLGGGKSVIIGDPKTDKSKALFRSFGRYVESLNGRYIAAEDVNISVEDVGYILEETSHVVGVSESRGGSGNPAPYTARGVFRGIEASCYHAYGNRLVAGKTIAIQGVGAVGIILAQILSEHGAQIIFTDINDDNVFATKERIPTARYVDPEAIYSTQCDIFVPCALGAIINDDTIDLLQCRIVAGSANNQLKENKHGDMLRKKGIFYAPDYLINAGGLMSVSLERSGWSSERANKMVDTIYDTTIKIFTYSEQNNIPIYQATDQLAEERIKNIEKTRANQLRQRGKSRSCR